MVQDEAKEIAIALARHRESIDNLDAAMVYLLAERFRITHAVGLLKRDNNLPAADRDREAAQISRLRSIAETAGLDTSLIDVVFPSIMEEVRRRHRALRDSDTPHS